MVDHLGNREGDLGESYEREEGKGQKKKRLISITFWDIKKKKKT